MAIFKKKHKRDGIERYYIRFAKQDGRRKVEKAGTTRKQAEKLLKKRLGEVATDAYVDPREVDKSTGPTFQEFADRFQKDYGSLRRSDHYQQNLAPLRTYFGDKPLREITRADLDAFTVWRGRKVGPSTLRKNLTALGTLFKMAVRWDVLDASPAVDLDKPSEPHHKVRYLTREEWDALMEGAPEWLRPILRMALASGLRLKEAVNLRWADIDRKAGVLYVSEDSKTGRPDPVPLTKEAKAVLQEQRFRSKGNGYVFRKANGKPYADERDRNAISKATIVAMKEAGIEGASFHSLRHTCASWMVQRNVSLAKVQRVMRHRNTQTTLRYAHLHPEHLRDTVSALDAALATQTATCCEEQQERVAASSATHSATISSA